MNATLKLADLVPYSRSPQAQALDSSEGVGISRQRDLAQGGQIVVATTLIRVLPAPLRRFMVDMSSAERGLLGLGASAEAKVEED